ncbi:glycosyltransferase family 39 protein [Nocardia noduli]|uniref:glycosyltransferase family 39 protein n=1 Tax=Nocardia noduli TaxID=2815722 RepID=UPI0020B3A795|nr:glycosyltransferase family 39 protein [Nocardia noduli]
MYWVAGIFAAVLAAFANRYGYHRDELYFMAAGRRLDWGYADQPPLTPLLARAMTAIDPDSLVLLRLPALVAATLVVLCAGWMAGAFGGGRGARALAAATVAGAALTLGAGHMLNTAVFDLAAWSVICLLTVRLLRAEEHGGDPRWWLVIGVVVGLGLQNKLLLIFPVVVLVV